MVGEKENGKKLVSVLQATYRKMPASAVYKALRKKDIKVNGIRVHDNVALAYGDEIELYIKDEIVHGKTTSYKVEESRIVYEDENILVYNKPVEIEVQGKSGELGLEQALCEQKQFSFLKACHRLDRNTTGLVMFAKNEETERILLQVIQHRGIQKYYQAQVYGIPSQKEATLQDYLFKDAKKSQVILSREKKKGYQEIITKYRVLTTNLKENTAWLEVELVTGRTHQIRAHLAYIGYPIIGDGKYGNNQVNQKFHQKYQQLCCYKLVFQDMSDKLSYLQGKTIEI